MSLRISCWRFCRSMKRQLIQRLVEWSMPSMKKPCKDWCVLSNTFRCVRKREKSGKNRLLIIALQVNGIQNSASNVPRISCPITLFFCRSWLYVFDFRYTISVGSSIAWTAPTAASTSFSWLEFFVKCSATVCCRQSDDNNCYENIHINLKDPGRFLAGKQLLQKRRR